MLLITMQLAKVLPTANDSDFDYETEMDDANLAESGPRRMVRSRGPVNVGQYLVSEPIAQGGMASVHLGVVSKDGRRILAMKRLHPHLVDDQYFTRMLLDEAAIASAVRHRNVVTTYGGEIIDADNTFLIMEYVAGISLAEAIRRSEGYINPRFAVSIVSGALRGLHAAHQAVDKAGHSLGIVHRDVSPQNVLIGLDGVPRVFDFGIAMAARRCQSTRAGEIKGKLAYMAPEQLLLEAVDHRADIHAAGVVLWEALVGCPLFHAESEGATVARVLDGCQAPPSRFVSGIPHALDAVVMKALHREPSRRFQSALEFADALDAVFASQPVSSRELGQWVATIGYDQISAQASLGAELQRRSTRPAAPVLDDRTFQTSRKRTSSGVAPATRSGINTVRPPRQVATKSSRPVVDVLLILALVLFSALGGALVMHMMGAIHGADAHPAAGATETVVRAAPSQVQVQVRR